MILLYVGGGVEGGGMVYLRVEHSLRYFLRVFWGESLSPCLFRLGGEGVAQCGGEVC